MDKEIIGFLGAGNMGQSLIRGLMLNGYSGDKLWVCDHHQSKLEKLLNTYPALHTTQQPHTLIQNSTVLVLAIKPQGLRTTLSELSPILQRYKPLLISIAAGISTTQIDHWLATPLASNAFQIIRAMPNTPACLQAGMTGLYADNTIGLDNKKIAEQLFASVGETLWVQQEDLLDIVTALSGSGPAYFFYILEALIASATRLGLPLSTAQKLAQYTMLGAAKMAINSDDLIALRQQVTSKGGTTEAGIQALEHGKLSYALEQALIAATQRSRSLKDQYF